MESVVFHIISSKNWAEAQEFGRYAPDRFDIEGFIHLSKKSQILRPANLLYKGQRDLSLLVIDVALLQAKLVYEPGSHGETELFPHLYGELNLDAVTNIIRFRCEPDGSFALPPELAGGQRCEI